MKVSVIIPTFNRSHLVQLTIDSVLNQTFKDYEIIVVDDGSTDDTEEQLVKYLDRITYIKTKNKGVNSARNTALKSAQGEYIALLDNDDLWLDFKLELETELLDKYPESGFIFSDFFVLKDGKNRVANGLHKWHTGAPDWNNIFESSTEYTHNITTKEIIRDKLNIYFGDIYHNSLFGPRVLPSASLYRKSFTDGKILLNENNSACGDWQFFAELSHAHNSIYIDIETALNRSHEDAVRLTRRDHKIQLNQRISMVENIWKRDNVFYSKYNKEVDIELTTLYKYLFKYQIKDGFILDARNSLNNIDNIMSESIYPRLIILKIIAYFPGNIIIFKLFRYFKQLFS